jgi:hypothetical protein
MGASMAFSQFGGLLDNCQMMRLPPSGARPPHGHPDMLNLADAVAVIDKRFGRDLFKQADNGDPYTALRNHLGDRAYLADILDRRASKHRLSLGTSAILSRRRTAIGCRRSLHKPVVTGVILS